MVAMEVDCNPSIYLA